MDLTGAQGPSHGDAFTALPPAGEGLNTDSWTGERGRFVPGTLIAGRFRIVALLGRGGMGEVYRADDLRLDQAVALKFLPSEYSEDPGRLSRLLREVRLAREITHPAVCRVYDFFDTDGHRFVSMEYVDGENLAGLLRRIGRLPQAKALEIAHQILLGLAAAHEKGILHRDLKPENIMIDGRGQAHLMDFGIAALRESRPASSESGFIMGTPAYLAPELLRGKSASEQSDIYALGVLFFELFTGQKPFKPKDIPDCMRMHLEDLPPSPASIVKDLDPAVAEAILRCLEKSPVQRPVSARALASGLPGGDALANAMAAGLTPAPDVVADAEVGDRAPLWVIWGLILATFGFIGIYMLMAPKATVMGYLPSAKSAPVLVDRSTQILRETGWSDARTDARRDTRPDARYYYMINTMQLMRMVKTGGWEGMDAGASPLTFHYFRAHAGWVLRGWPPPEMDKLILDHRGRLRELDIMVPKSLPADERADREPDWTVLFREAELDPAAFDLTSSFLLSNHAGDLRKTWVQRTVEGGAEPLQVMAIATGGRPSYFGVAEPRRVASLEDRRVSRRVMLGRDLMYLIYLGTFVLAGVMAWVHLKAGRGDRQGAWRLAVASALARLIFGLLAEWLRFSLIDLVDSLGRMVGPAIFYGAITWMLYLAAEPFIRRHWPLSMVSWARLLAGRWKDALVGRDILSGLCVGAATATCLVFIRAYPLPRGILPLFPFFPYPETFLSPAAVVAVILRDAVASIGMGLGVVLGTVLVWRVVRYRWLALLLVYMLVLIPYSVLSGSSIPVFLLVHGIIFTLPILLLRYSGLLAFSSFFFALVTLTWGVGTSDWDSWVGHHSLIAVAVLMLMALASFRFALGGRSPLGRLTT